LGVSTADVVMVGDSRFDVEAAFAAGVNSIGVNGIKGDYSIDSMDDLLFTISKIDGEPRS